MAIQSVPYMLDDGTTVYFEVDTGSGFAPASAADRVVQMRSAVEPAIKAAKLVLDKARAAAPDSVRVTFGIKVNGTANWMIARAATEASFEVALEWHSTGPVPRGDGP
jgi:hypothetical protein